MKTVFLIPGFKESATGEGYKWLRNVFHGKGYVVKPVPISWNYRTMSDYIAEFEDFYSQHEGESNYVLGFSYGAVIALCSAEKLRPNRMYLCSLSPDFKEDVDGMEDWIQKYIGKRRLEDCKKRSGVKIAKSLTIPTVIFYGEQEVAEFPQMKKRIRETQTLAENVKVIEVKDAPHNISFPTYKAAISKVIQARS